MPWRIFFEAAVIDNVGVVTKNLLYCKVINASVVDAPIEIFVPQMLSNVFPTIPICVLALPPANETPW